MGLACTYIKLSETTPHTIANFGGEIDRGGVGKTLRNTRCFVIDMRQARGAGYQTQMKMTKGRT